MELVVQETRCSMSSSTKTATHPVISMKCWYSLCLYSFRTILHYFVSSCIISCKIIMKIKWHWYYPIFSRRYVNPNGEICYWNDSFCNLIIIIYSSQTYDVAHKEEEKLFFHKLQPNLILRFLYKPWETKWLASQIIRIWTKLLKTATRLFFRSLM